LKGIRAKNGLVKQQIFIFCFVDSFLISAGFSAGATITNKGQEHRLNRIGGETFISINHPTSHTAF
jgi:hypothetical protein